MTARTLLIVDDSPAVCAALCTYLGRGSWDAVVVARDAGAALLLAQKHQPAAVVLDNSMPGGDGIDVLPALRATCPDARIVMHTSEDTGQLRERALALGADGFVAKGRPLAELDDALQTVIETAS